MKLEEAITYAIMSDGHGKTTDQIAAAINRNGWILLRVADDHIPSGCYCPPAQ